MTMSYDGPYLWVCTVSIFFAAHFQNPNCHSVGDVVIITAQNFFFRVPILAEVNLGAHVSFIFNSALLGNGPVLVLWTAA